MGYHLGVEVGGTFTDVLLLDEASGAAHRAKTMTTPYDHARGVLNGIHLVCRLAGITPAKVTGLRYSTSVATNALVEGKGARVGLVTTQGFRQLLQLARSYVPGGPGAGWILWPKPEPLARQDNTVEVVERIAQDGSVAVPLDVPGARTVLRRLRAAGIEALTISLLNSYANDEHEQLLGRIAADELPGIPISLSATVLPEQREFERTITTVVNSYVQPAVARQLSELNQGLRVFGMNAPLAVLRSDGRLTTAREAAENPVTVLLSGPAGGVGGARWFAEQVGFADFLSLDMGGTSTDVALVLDGQPGSGPQTSIGDLKVRASSLDVRTVGTGGGSIVHVPELSRVPKVGPDSAGAVPGPAGYGRGGQEPTVTDANLVLGCLPAELAGGEIRMDPEASWRAVATVARSMRLPTEQAAAEIVSVVNENLYRALRLVSVQRGFDSGDFPLLVFGGAGPLHANALGRLAGSWPVVVPPSAGTLGALGAAMTALSEQESRPLALRLSAVRDAELRAELAELAAVATQRLTSAGGLSAEVRFEIELRSLDRDCRLPVELSAEMLAAPDLLTALGEGLVDEQVLTFPMTADDCEISQLRATVSGHRLVAATADLPDGGPDPAGALVRHTKIWVDGELVGAGVYDRAKLSAGNVVAGPAMVVEPDSTTLVLPEHTATVHPSGCLFLAPAPS